jgi:hypothetical protein
MLVVGMLLIAKLFFSDANPLWNYIEAWPRTLEDQDLASKLNGLIRFGLPGSRWKFVETESGDQLEFAKDSAAGESRIILTVLANGFPVALSEPLRDRLTLALGSNDDIDFPSDGNIILNCGQPARFEAVARAMATELGHLPNTKYRCSSRGPNDEGAIADFLS